MGCRDDHYRSGLVRLHRIRDRPSSERWGEELLRVRVSKAETPRYLPIYGLCGSARLDGIPGRIYFVMYVLTKPTGWAGSNSVIFGEYILHAAEVEVNRWNQRGIGLACITAAFLIHGLALKWGLRLQNFLGIIKLLIILLIVFAGWAALGGALKIDEKPNNFENAFEGTTGSAYGVVTALYNVIWSYIGYSNANYALSETKDPVRTLKIAAPLALGIISVLYMLVNVCNASADTTV
jgi:amino acid transporter